ncbi:PTS system, mannitol-specific IIB component [Euzebya pacifica]|uniref:PTS system, mannitol-specific IIB component n=1 Tax=Euzebya pacifica TaxID=1608957 RepID=A0A346XVY0_9ACTN|nr:PTS mannitol transporter subunit IICB [Euzebya pacifica]AXV06377.1 PTS system, mannitol-specific IIB component [Euzebya pacifica]
MNDAGAAPEGTWVRLRTWLQRVGGNLAGMVMPNIGAFIAWGLLSALFLPAGWIPNEGLASLSEPMVTTLLPVLIGLTGGRVVHDQRGGVIGAIATMGIVVGSDVPQLLGAMVAGPLAALALRQVDRSLRPRVRAGFEMLVDNFSLGLLGLAMAVLGYVAIGPVVSVVTVTLGDGVDWMVANHLLPVVSVIVEPAKVLFLNNAVNHGVLAPLGAVEAERIGQSLVFMIETNPGPGLGILLAFWLAGPRDVRPTVPGAVIIHFLGGIHEISFPYVLMKPRLLIAAIAGGATGVATFMLTGAGLVATPSPGSIFAWLAVMPRGGYVGPLLGILLSTLVSAGVGTLLLKAERRKDTAGDLADARTRSSANKWSASQAREA